MSDNLYINNYINNYIKNCKEVAGERWIRYAFDNVTSLEDCEELKKEYTREHGDQQFLSFAKYTMDNTFQVATETWYQYLEKSKTVSL